MNPYKKTISKKIQEQLIKKEIVLDKYNYKHLRKYFSQKGIEIKKQLCHIESEYIYSYSYKSKEGKEFKVGDFYDLKTCFKDILENYSHIK